MPATSISPMWLTSNSPAARRTARCSSVMPAYWTGISHPANGTIFAPKATWRPCKGVLSRAEASVMVRFGSAVTGRPRRGRRLAGERGDGAVAQESPSAAPIAGPTDPQGISAARNPAPSAAPDS